MQKKELNLECKDCNKSLEDCTCIEDTIDMKQKTLEEAKKQQFKYDNLQDAKEISSRIKVVETLEEVAERFANECNSYDAKLIADGVEYGANWQAEKMYSEEDIMNALHSVELKDNKDYSKIYNGMKEWFKQFKKK
jgi:hypothetical protein